METININAQIPQEIGDMFRQIMNKLERQERAIAELRAQRKEKTRPAAMVNVRGVAEMTGLSTDSVYRLVRAGEMPNIKVGGKVMFQPEEIEEWIGSRRRRSATEIRTEAAEIAREAMDSMRMFGGE